jgi:transcriptional regulator with XRE-family HTH domain
MEGDELRRIRKRLRLTQVQMAERLGWHPNSVARAERSEMPITEPVAKLARLLIQLEKRTKHSKRRR